MKATRFGMFMFGAATLLACAPQERDDGGTDDDTDADSDADSDQSTDTTDDTVMEKKCNKMDIIFVVDDSASMEQEQANLATNFPQFANILGSYVTADGDPLDYRIAVTTTGKTFTINAGGIPITEQGDNGAFREGCGVGRRWIETTDGTTALACRADVGIDGPGNEMPFMTTKLALEERMTDGTNSGFLRDDALLAVVILTDEDDTSSTESSATISITNPDSFANYHAEDLIAFLDAKKGNRTRWAAGVLAGDPPAGQSKCSGAFGDAARATRLQEFVTKANSQGTTQAVFSSICQGDLTQGLQAALTTFQNACETIVY